MTYEPHKEWCVVWGGIHKDRAGNWVREPAPIDVDLYPPEKERVWTVSRDPEKPGWNTDGGYEGYGLTRKEAEYLCNAANLYHLQTT